MNTTPPRKKLIEVALPLDAINTASAREKSIRHGHPATLHLWWARRPLAAARAVLFAQMVDDPSAWPELFPTEAAQQRERERLFRIIEHLVVWEHTTNEEVLERARCEIRRSWARHCLGGTAAERLSDDEIAEAIRTGQIPPLPGVHDPFAGGGSIPLEAQRLGLAAYASDLNPVAVTINKAMIEIPPRFRDCPPVNPQDRQQLDLNSWYGAQGLAADVRYYGQWMREQAQQRIGHLYPPITITAELAADRADLRSLIGQQLTVIAWLWARTVRSPNPAFAHVEVPLVTTFVLSSKPGHEAYVEPVVEGDTYHFTVRVGTPPAWAKNGTKLARGANFRCLLSQMPIKDEYIKAESMAGRMGAQMLAIVAEGPRGRVYLPPTAEHEAIARSAQPTWKPDLPMNRETTNLVSGRGYGFFTWADLFTPRQLVALTTFADLVGEAMEQVKRDYLSAREGTPASGPGTPASGAPATGSLGTRASGAPAAGIPSTPASASPLKPPRGWHSRGYHPHLDTPGVVHSITFCLADSVPAALLTQWREELGLLVAEQQQQEQDPNPAAHHQCPQPGADRHIREAEVRKRIERYADAGHGACWLRDPRIAELVEHALLHFDGERYRLLEWCMMPNHVHVLLETLPGYPLGDVVRSWKTVTAREANQLLNRTGSFWMGDYFDRCVRDERHLAAVRAYIREHPVRAGLCATAEEWRWGSAWAGRAGGPRTQAGQGEDPRTQDDDDLPLHAGGTGATAYAQAVGVYLALAVSKMSDAQSSLCRWKTTMDQSIATFGRQALPMVWDYSEANAFGGMAGDFTVSLKNMMRVLDGLPNGALACVTQADAQTQTISANKLISTDPPYYDNIGYADLSDFFYVWLRRTLRPVFPDLYATLSTPKAEELVATPYRHGSKQAAERFFMDGMTRALHNLAEQAHPAFPVTIYYAFKQHEVREAQRDESATGELGDPDPPSSLRSAPSSTGWETFLEAVIQAGFAITGTWPMRTELGNRILSQGTNALASSIVLVCRPRPADAPIATRREFINALKAELPTALAVLQHANIAPVDLAQAAIGPGMAIYTRSARVVDTQGNPVRVREALTLINQVLDEVLAEQESDFDADTRWALAWFEQYGFAEGEYGVAETLSKAKNTSVEGLVAAGMVEAKRGKVRLLAPAELPAAWDPAGDSRVTHWEAVHHLIRVLNDGGELAAAALAAKLGSRADVARELAYRLYTICERKKRPDEAFAYNALVQSWSEIARLALAERQPHATQQPMEL